MSKELIIAWISVLVFGGLFSFLMDILRPSKDIIVIKENKKEYSFDSSNEFETSDF